ncbi:MAG: hypothetical protein ACYSTY_14730, partial [Planctomycetota bacterium]
SPVADAIVNMIRAGAGLREFDYQDANELVQYATRRGLIPSAEGAQVLEEVQAVVRDRGRRRSPTSRAMPKRSAKPAAAGKKKTVTRKTAVKAAPKTAKKKTTTKTATKKASPKRPTAKAARSPKKKR